jgi:hypothetical protein
MTDQQHRATPEQWASIDDPENPFAYEVCILELRDRITALEAGQACPHIVNSDEGTSYCALAEQTHSKPTPNDRQIRSSAPADSLVERVAIAMRCAPNCDDESWETEARAAIREVARWLRSELVSRAVSDRLEQEANL